MSPHVEQFGIGKGEFGCHHPQYSHPTLSVSLLLLLSLLCAGSGLCVLPPSWSWSMTPWSCMTEEQGRKGQKDNGWSRNDLWCGICIDMAVIVMFGMENGFPAHAKEVCGGCVLPHAVTMVVM